jgi:hypothetical protein
VPPKKKPAVKIRSRCSASTRAHAPSTSTPEAARGSKGERIALLIDADNVSHGFLPTLRDFVGETTLASARAYGDFQNRLHNWRKAAEAWPALELVEQRNYTAGKNATDMRLTIDAVKLLAGKKPPTTLVFVTNDSDFTPIVEDAKKDGVRIVVMGERPHRSLRSAAHHYVNLTELRERLEHKATAESDPREVLRLLLAALRSLPKLNAAAQKALAEAERRLPLLRFATGRPTPSTAFKTDGLPTPSRARRGRRTGTPAASPPSATRQNEKVAVSNDVHAIRRKEALLTRTDLIQSLVDAARSLPNQDGWVKGEFILRRVREMVRDFDQTAPRYAKFYRMLEDTGRFDVELRASTVFARPRKG